MAENGADKRKIAILGGGCGALATAFALTQDPAQRERLEVTVYQMGWRLGGKGASGRSTEAGFGQRIEEHGLHIWAGFYQNAFHLMRSCYEELGRPPDMPLAKWTDAFIAFDSFCLEERINGRWRHWPITFPQRPGAPGDAPGPFHPPSGPPVLWDLLQEALLWVSGHWLGQGFSEMLAEVRTLVERGDKASEFAQALQDVLSYMRELPPDIHQHTDNSLSNLEQRLRRARDLLHLEYEILGDLSDGLRRFRITADFIITGAIGIVVDDVLRQGFDAIDQFEIREWLRQHGAGEETINSSIITSADNYVFGFKSGDIRQPAQAAGTALRACARFSFGYRGSVFWRMAVGMGDAVFAPLYLVLKRRGVVFKFFHRVDALDLSADGRRIERIRIAQQIETKQGDYDPLIEVKGLPVWPSRPKFELLKSGDELQASWDRFDLESDRSQWPHGVAVELVRGTHFDDVVLGISIGAFGKICTALIARSADWRTMVEKIGTVRTLACQLWLTESTRELGWQPQAGLLTDYEQRFNTLMDMSHLLKWEDWPEHNAPRSIVYMCGPLHDPGAAEGPLPERAAAQVTAHAQQWITNYAGGIMPGFQFNHLYDGQTPLGDDPFQAQYFRANVNQSDRYVQYLPGTSQHRLRAGASGFDNLYLAGDWVRTGLNAGCVEAAVMSGLQAARAILKDDRPVPGETDW